MFGHRYAGQNEFGWSDHVLTVASLFEVSVQTDFQLCAPEPLSKVRLRRDDVFRSPPMMEPGGTAMLEPGGTTRDDPVLAGTKVPARLACWRSHLCAATHMGGLTISNACRLAARKYFLFSVDYFVNVILEIGSFLRWSKITVATWKKIRCWQPATPKIRKMCLETFQDL